MALSQEFLNALRYSGLGFWKTLAVGARALLMNLN